MSDRGRSTNRPRRDFWSQCLRLVLSIGFLLGTITLETEEAGGCHDHGPLHPSVSCDACWVSASHTSAPAPREVSLTAPEILLWSPRETGETAVCQGAERPLHHLRAPPRS